MTTDTTAEPGRELLPTATAARTRAANCCVRAVA
jgi:hypothetical protein